MEAWQLVVAVFFTLLPVVLMLDFWGDERLDSRGRPKQRDWPFERSAGSLDDEVGHDQYAGTH